MIFAMNTSGDSTQFWLLDDKSSASPVTTSWNSGRTLADELLGRITQFLHHSEVAFGRLTGIIVFSGPGSFTSLRIGHSVANALGDSLAIPVQGARGDDWLDKGVEALKKAPANQLALPYYGAEANISKLKT